MLASKLGSRCVIFTKGSCLARLLLLPVTPRIFFSNSTGGTEARATTRVQSHCRKKPHTWYGGFCSQSPSSSLFQSLGLLAPASRKCFSQSFKYRKESMTPEAHVCITFVMHMCACGGQKTTRWGQFSSTTWVSGDVGVPS